MELNYNSIDFKETLLNLDKSIKYVKIVGDIDIKCLCDILEDVKPNIIIECKDKKLVEEEFMKRNTYQGFNRSILNMVKKIIRENVSKNDYVVDMTIGNGYDTLYLAEAAKWVFGFDIQDEAIKNTNDLLRQNNINNYTLYLDSHENIDKKLKDYIGNIKLILFNLGYLPKGDKKIMTNHSSTLKALINSLKVIKDDGLILIVFYPHEEGKMEENVVMDYLNTNRVEYKVYRNTNNIDAPFLVVI